MSYDRYSKFRHNGTVDVVPYIEIPVKSTDYYETYVRGTTRLDQLSYDYYDDPSYDWLILMANPSLGMMEFEIPDGSTVRIPYPLAETLEGYQDSISKYNKYYKNS